MSATGSQIGATAPSCPATLKKILWREKSRNNTILLGIKLFLQI